MSVRKMKRTVFTWSATEMTRTLAQGVRHFLSAMSAFAE